MPHGPCSTRQRQPHLVEVLERVIADLQCLAEPQEAGGARPVLPALRDVKVREDAVVEAHRHAQVRGALAARADDDLTVLAASKRLQSGSATVQQRVKVEGDKRRAESKTMGSPAEPCCCVW